VEKCARKSSEDQKLARDQSLFWNFEGNWKSCRFVRTLWPHATRLGLFNMIPKKIVNPCIGKPLHLWNQRMLKCWCHRNDYGWICTTKSDEQAILHSSFDTTARKDLIKEKFCGVIVGSYSWRANQFTKIFWSASCQLKNNCLIRGFILAHLIRNFRLYLETLLYYDVTGCLWIFLLIKDS
jgi:hypothetical protein